MRLTLIIVAALAATVALAQPTDLGTAAPVSAPAIFFTRAAGVHAVQDLPLQLERGENRLLIDAGALETDPASLRVRLLEPAAKVRLTGTAIGPQAGQVVVSVCADDPAPARLRLVYEIATLAAETSYTLTLDPARQKLAWQADVTMRNNGKHELRQVKVTLAQGQQVTLNLQPGETVQQQLFVWPELPYEVGYLYDNTRFKDSVRTILTLPSEARTRGSLSAGKARVFASGAGGRTFIADAAVPYAPAGEKLELDLGVAADFAVLRNRLRSDQVNTRSDVYHKLALFDLEEEYELELTNQRTGPASFVVREHVAGDWQLLKASHPLQQTDSGTLEFAVKLPAGAKEKLTYSVKRLNVEP